MNEINHETRMHLHPRFMITRDVFEHYTFGINKPLLEDVLQAYDLRPSHINHTDITVTHGLHAETPGQFGTLHAEYGRFSVLKYRNLDDDEQFDERKITIFMKPHILASSIGYIAHSNMFEKSHGVLNLNLSSTLVHEIGHLAAYVHAQDSPATARKSIRDFFKLRIPQDRKPVEELWVRQQTVTIMENNVRLESLITAEEK